MLCRFVVALCAVCPLVFCCAVGYADEAAIEALGGKVTKTDGVVTKVFFQNCAKLGDAEFRMLGKLSELKGLTLYGQCKGLNDTTLAHLAGLSNLEELGTDGIQVTDAGLAGFAAFKNLRSLAFFHPSLGMPGFNGSGFAALKALPKLEKLTIAGTSFDDRGMAAVAEIKQLRDFRTWHTYQTQAGNEYLTELPLLRSLWLGQRLRRYDGKPNTLSLDDSTFTVLAKLTGLEALTLDEAELSPAALARLKELPKLTKLDLKRIDIAPTEIERLRAELPKTTIVFTPLTDEERQKLKTFLHPPGK